VEKRPKMMVLKYGDDNDDKTCVEEYVCGGTSDWGRRKRKGTEG
jgi:hypothetical protein